MLSLATDRLPERVRRLRRDRGTSLPRNGNEPQERKSADGTKRTAHPPMTSLRETF